MNVHNYLWASEDILAKCRIYPGVRNCDAAVDAIVSGARERKAAARLRQWRLRFGCHAHYR